MKKLMMRFLLSCFSLSFVFISNQVEAQTNTGIFFQAVARDVYSNPAKDRKIYIQSSIIQSTPTGTKVLVEEHQSQTDATGVFSISVGQGTRKEGTAANLTAIEWAKGPYYLNLKISIVPIAPAANWDYTKEWLDIGTTPFGTVPYALYSGSSGALDSKLNIADTAKMLALYAKAQTVQSLSTAVSTKVSTNDTSAMLAPYKAAVKALVESNITSLTASAINSALDSKLNIADSTKLYITPTQLAAKTFDSTAIYKQLDKKADIVYVDSVTANLVIPSADSITNGTIILAGDLSGTASSPLIANKAITTAKVADSAITDSKILSISGSKVVGNIAGKAATATKLASSVTINGVAFDGSSNITIASSIANALTMNNSGTGAASGTVYDGSAAKTISYNSIGASPLAGSSSLTTVGTITTGVWSGTAIANNKLANSSLTIGSTNIALGGTSSSLAGLSSVTSTNFTGNLTGDVSGNASTATTAGNITATSNTSLTSLSNLNTVGTITSGIWSGTAISLSKGGTGATTASAARTNLGLVIGTDVQAPLSFTAPLQSSSNIVSMNQATTSVDGYLSASDFTNFNNKIDATQKAANNGVATLGNDGKIPSNQIPAISFQSANVVTSESAMLALSSAVVGSIAIRTDNNNNYVLSALPASTLSNWIRLATPTSVTSVNGFAGPNVSLTTNDVSEGTTNKYYTDARVRGALSAVSPLSFNASSGTFSMSAASGSSNGYLSSSDFTTFNNKQNALTAGVDYLAPNGSAALLTSFPTLNQSTTGNAATATKLAATKNINGVAFDGSSDITITATSNTLSGTTLASNVVNSSLTSVGTITAGIWSGTTIAIAKGGTGATSASAALTNLGGEASANKSTATDLGSTNPSDILYPTQKAVKTYVDLQSANAGVADLSITNAKLAGNITANKLVGTDISTVGTITTGVWNGSTIAITNGGTGATTAASARSNLGLVIGTDVLAPNASITGATKTKITYDAKGLVTSGADATTADIAPSTNRNYVTDAQSGVLSNTSGVNTGDQTITLTGDIAGSGTGSFATTVNSVGGVSSATIATLPTSVNANTASITAETARATNAESGLDTRIISNTSSITSNTSSITTINTTLGTKADIASPAFTGVPTAPTASTGTSSTQIATTAFVNAAITNSNLTIGAISGTSNAKGAIISGTTELILTPADANFGGVVTTATQTFAGSKTFTNSVTFGTDITVNGIKIGKGGGNNSSNTAVGSGALALNTTGSGSTAFGNNALSKSTGGNATAFGSSALENLTTGTANVAVGYTALNQTSSQNSNTAVGDQAMRMSTGANNTVLGASALSGIAGQTTGDNNTAIGTFALRNATTAAYNVGLGSNSLNNLKTGNDNTVLGYLSGYYAGAGTGANLTSMSQGVLIGSNVRAGTNTSTNEIAIGYNVVGNGSNTVTIGNFSNTANYFRGDINLTGNVNGGTWSGTVIGSNYGGAGTVNGLMKANGSGVVSAAIAGTDYLIPSSNIATATALATGRTISTTGDVTYTSGSFDGTANVTGTATLTNTTVTAGSYGSSTAIPTFTVDSKGRLTAANTVGITAGVSTLNYTSTTSYANGGTISGTSLTLTAADATNPGLISTGAQTIAGAKTFNSDVTAPNFLGNATTATSLATGRTISTIGDVIYTSGSFDGSANVTGVATLTNTTVTAGTYGSSTAIPTFTVDSKGRLTAASTVGITAGVSSLNYTSTTSFANGGTISGTILTLAAADGTNPGLISTGAQTIAGLKTFNNDIVINGLSVGRGAGQVASNVAFGATALNANTTGNYNVAVGSEALKSNTNGSVNVALGAATIDNLTSGNNNTVIGSFAGRNYGPNGGTTGNNTTMNNGILLGYDARPLSNAGTDEVVIGMRAIGHGSNTVTLGNSSNTKTYLTGDLSLTGNITSGTWSASVIDIAHGGTGSSTVLGAKTNLGLNNVENTALSTWTGSTNISTVGTLYAQGKTFWVQDLMLGYGSQNGTKIQTDANNKYISFYPNNSTESTRLWPSGNVTIQNGGTYTDNGYKLEVAGTTNFLGNSSITGNLGVTGSITGATWSGTVIGSNFGGSGSVNGLLKANGSGVVSAAVAGTDYQAPLTAGTSYVVPNSSITGATKTKITYDTKGLVTAGADATTADIAPSANRNYVTDAQAGVLSNTSGTNTGDQTITLTGDVTGTGTGTFTTTLANSGVTANTYGSSTLIPSITVDAKGRVTSASTASIIANAGTLTGTSLASTVTGSSLTSVGTIISGVWSGTAIANNNLANSSTTLGSTTMTLGGTVTSITGLTSLTSTTVVGNLSGTATTATNIAGGVIGAIPYQSAAGTTALLAGNTTSTVKYLASSGNGINSSAPTWVTPSFVPYSGATGAVDLGAYDLTVNGLTVGRGNTGNNTNSAFGASVLQVNTAGTDNTAVGYNALKSTTGSLNSAFGSLALKTNTTGSRNAAFGNMAIQANSTGNNNSAFGYGTLYGTTSSDNTAMGYLSGYGVTTGAKNIFIGSNAGAYFSTGNTSASYNTTGLNSVLIGYDVRPLANADDNEIVISGYNGTAGTVGLGSNTTLIGSSTTTTARIMGDLTLPRTTTSTTTTSGALVVSGGAGIAENINVGGTATIIGAATISNTTTSSSTTTGALKVGGGVGIVGNVNVGGTLGVTGATTLAALTTTGAATISSTLTIPTGAAAGKVLTSDANGGATWKSGYTTISTKTADYTLTLDDNFIIVGSSATTGKTFTLPTASGCAGKEFTIKNLSAFSVSIATTSSQYIIQDNSTITTTSATIGIEPSNNWIKVISDGTSWIAFRALF